MAEYLYARAGAVNHTKLDSEVKTIPGVIGFRTEPGTIVVMTNTDLTQPQRDTLAGIVTAHNPADTPAQTEALANTAALTLLKANNAGRMKYFPYFVHLQDEYLSMMADVSVTEQQAFTRILAALKWQTGTNADHLFAYNMFLRESSRVNNVNVTDAVLTGLLYPARRTFYAEVKAFLNTGLLAGLSVMLRNGG